MSRYTDKEKSIWNKAIYSVTRDILVLERKCIAEIMKETIHGLTKWSRFNQNLKAIDFLASIINYPTSS